MSAVTVIAGIDEAGRGAIAGPVVAGACVLPFPLFRRRHPLPRWSPFHRKPKHDCIIADSKILDPEQREHAYAWISSHCAFGVGVVSYEEIEHCGILRATERAMRLALDDLRKRSIPDSLLVDGRDHFSFDVPHTSVIRGDRTQPCIAAASIVAKVTRDRIMTAYAPQFPAYKFELHKGYGTQKHIDLLRKHGPCSIHRLSFLTRILPIQEALDFALLQKSSTAPATKIGSV